MTQETLGLAFRMFVAEGKWSRGFCRFLATYPSEWNTSGPPAAHRAHARRMGRVAARLHARFCEATTGEALISDPAGMPGRGAAGAPGD